MIKSSATLGGVFLREEPPHEAPYNRSNMVRQLNDGSRNLSISRYGERGNLDSHQIMHFAPGGSPNVFAEDRRTRSPRDHDQPSIADAAPRVPLFNGSNHFEINPPTEKPHTLKDTIRKFKHKRATTDRYKESYDDFAKRPTREARTGAWFRPKMVWWVVILCWLVELGLRVVSFYRQMLKQYRLDYQVTNLHNFFRGRR